MNQAVYREIIRELASIVGLADHFEKIYESGNLTFKDVGLTIFFNEQAGSSVNVYVDFGAHPEGKSLAVFRRLLEINLLVSSPGSPRLGLDPQTGRVIFVYAHALEGLTAQRLLGSIDVAVGQAAAWRETFYLDEPGTRDADLRHALQV